MSEGPAYLFLFWGKQMGKHTLVSWHECPTVTIMTLARTAASDADPCYLAHIIFNLAISINASCLNGQCQIQKDFLWVV